MAGGDVTKIDAVLKMNCHTFSYWASYLIDKRNVEAARYKNNNN